METAMVRERITIEQGEGLTLGDLRELVNRTESWDADEQVWEPDDDHGNEIVCNLYVEQEGS